MNLPAVLGVDPATRSGWGLVAMDAARPAGVVLASGVVKRTTGRAIGEVVRAALAAATLNGCPGVVVAIEDQFLGRAANNPQTLKVVARMAGKWEGVCEDAGLTVEFVPAATWQGAVLGLRGVARMKREQLKPLAQDHAERLAGFRPATDEADGICLGMFVARQRYMDARLGR